MKRWISLFCVLLGTSCSMNTTATETPVIYEVPMEEPFVEPTTTPDCQHAEGVAHEILRISGTTVELRVSGLQPGERPTIIYSTSSSDVGASMGEMYDFAEGADEHGEFSIALTGLMPLKGKASATWDIRLIHSRGVECARITMP